MEYINIFTIGFTKKSAESFFTEIKNAKIKKVIDIRLNNASQLAGFTKKHDIKYFLHELCGCQYIHLPLWAPTKEILDDYKKKKLTWSEYEKHFNDLLVKRDAHTFVKPSELQNVCLMCSEPAPDQCHRRLLAEYLKRHFDNIEIKHL